MAFFHSPHIITNGLVLYIDPPNSKCYPKSGTKAQDLKYPMGWDMIGSLTYESSSNAFNNYSTSSASYLRTDVSFNFTSNSSSLTYDFWLYPNSSPSMTKKYPTFINDNISQGNVPFIWAGIDGYDVSLRTFIQAGDTATYRNYWGPQLITYLDQWLNYVITFRYGSIAETSIKFYINGLLKQTTSGFLSKFPDTGSLKNIGSYRGVSPATYNWTGKIGPIKIYNRLLSDSEILQNYNALKGRFGMP